MHSLYRYSHDFECNLEYISTSKFLKSLKNLRVLIYSKLHEKVMRVLVNGAHAKISIVFTSCHGSLVRPTFTLLVEK